MVLAYRELAYFFSKTQLYCFKLNETKNDLLSNDKNLNIDFIILGG